MMMMMILSLMVAAGVILKFICSWKCFQKMPIEDTHYKQVSGYCLAKKNHSCPKHCLI